MQWSSKDIQQFRKDLVEWGASISRPMPWKGSKDPYKVWLSEIILQQTRVEQGLPYFERFVERYPSIMDLAEAKEDDVLKLWEGLGYYSRARNLHFTAKFVAKELGGKFPSDHKSILALKGVGPYTAAAIASFAFGLSHAVVDGNVFRVLTRIFGIDTPVDSTAGKKEITNLASALIDPQAPAAYNQAMMDFGALQCTPKAPNCIACPFQNRCIAFKKNKVSSYPVKSKRIKKRNRYFQYLVLEYNGLVWLQQRTEKDIWQHLYEFPLLETEELELSAQQLKRHPDWQKAFNDSRAQIVEKTKLFRQVLTHQNIHAFFWEVQLEAPLSAPSNHLFSVDRKNLSKFAFPKIIDWYLNDKSLYLKLY